MSPIVYLTLAAFALWAFFIGRVVVSKLKIASRRHAERVGQAQSVARFESGEGGSAENPICVPVSSVIEPRARSLRCPQCTNALRVEQHGAQTLEGRSLRVLEMVCVWCDRRRQVYFRITPGP